MTDKRMTVAAARATRAKLLLVLPLTMALLVGATGFFALSMTSRLYVLHGTGEVAADMIVGQLGMQIAAVSLIAAILGLSIAMGVTRPVRQITQQLEALASGDLRGALQISSTSELDSLGGAFNDALTALQRHYFQSMTGAVITLDADGRVIGSSPAAEATLGYREEDLVGRRFSEVFTPASGSRASLMAIEASIARRQPVAVGDVDIVAADGRPVRIGISASYLQQGQAGRAGSREVVGVMIEFKDLGQMRAIQARLQQADQLMALGTVTAGVAHEIRNPLASLRGLAELLGRDIPVDDHRRRYLDTMLESIDRLNRLIEDLLLFSSPRANEQDDDVELTAIAAETASLARMGLGDRPVIVEHINGAALPLVVRGSRERLIQVLTNIVQNATQAAPDGGAVTVRTEQRDGAALVAVHNTGSYIPPAIRRQLFVPFFTTKPTGTGLGLAIARQIVTSMEGRLEVESDEALGTTFTVELPLGNRELRVANDEFTIHDSRFTIA